MLTQREWIISSKCIDKCSCPSNRQKVFFYQLMKNIGRIYKNLRINSKWPRKK